MTVLGDAHVDVKQDIERFNSQREDITRNMAQVVNLEAKFERVRRTMEEKRGQSIKGLI